MSKRFLFSFVIFSALFCAFFSFEADAGSLYSDPVAGWRKTSGFIPNREIEDTSMGVSKGAHLAMDCIGSNTKICSIYDGIVIRTSMADKSGYYVIIEHDINGVTVYSEYQHLEEGSIRVKEGQSVSSGQQIATMGDTGNVKGVHLHIAIYTGNNPYNAWGGDLKESYNYQEEYNGPIEYNGNTFYNPERILTYKDYIPGTEAADSKIGEFSKVANLTVRVKITDDFYKKDQYTVNNEPYDAASIKKNVKVGDEFTTSGLYKNKYNNYWLRLFNGSISGYICVNEVKLVEQVAEPIASGLVYPMGDLVQNKSFDIAGNISANSTMPEVWAAVYKINDSSFTPVTAKLENVDRVDIKNSALNISAKGGIPFGTLPKGDYYYTLWAYYYTYHNVAETFSLPLSRKQVIFVEDTPFTVGGGSGNLTIYATGITLNNSSLSLNIDTSAALTATVSPANATNKAVTWTTSNSAVATVADGTVTAVGNGTATITCTAADGSGVKASCMITVNPRAVQADLQPIATTAYNGTYYELYRYDCTWEESAAFAGIKGGWTVTITSEGENKAIHDLIAPYGDIWLHGARTDNGFKWVTTEPFTYTNWAPGEPSNGDNVEKWMMMYSADGMWNDSTNSHVLNYVVVKHYAPWLIAATEFNGAKYELYSASELWASRAYSWDMAKASAASKGGWLATINSAEENEAVWNLIRDHGKSWIGGQYQNGKFGWITGETFQYTNWNAGEPNGGSAEPALVMYEENGRWNDYTSQKNDAILFFVVEYPITKQPATGISFTGYSRVIVDPGSTEQVRFTMQPRDAEVKEISYSSDNAAVVTVTKDGMATGIAQGTANINVKITNYDGSIITGTVPFTVLQSNVQPVATTKFDGTKYELYAVDCTFQGAQILQSIKNGRIVTITSADENKVVQRLIAPYGDTWLNGMCQGDSFSWENGEQFSYSNWAPGQPDNVMQIENRMMMYRADGAWNDTSDKTILHYVVIEIPYDIVASTIRIPKGTQIIEENAFEGIGACVVNIPEGCVSIEAHAFSNCENLVRVYIPASVKNISSTAFSGSNIVIYAPAGSVAQEYAQKQNLPFHAK